MFVSEKIIIVIFTNLINEFTLKYSAFVNYRFW